MTSDRYIFITSSLSSLEDFLKTDIAKYNYIHCTFKKNKIDFFTQKELKNKNIIHIGFTDTKDGMKNFIRERKLPDLIEEISQLSMSDRRYLLNYFNEKDRSINSVLTEGEYDLFMKSFKSDETDLCMDE